MERFFEAAGLKKETVSRMNLIDLMDALTTYINQGKAANGKPWKGSTKKTYAFAILSVLSKLRNEKLETMPVIRLWTDSLTKQAMREPKNSAPIVELDEVERKALELAPPHLKTAVKDLLHIQWAVMSRSTRALKGLGTVGIEEGKWRVSWLDQKTTPTTGPRDLWLEESEVTPYLWSRIPSFPQRSLTIYPEETILEADATILKALNGRSMSVRRSAAQEYMAKTNSAEKLVTRTLHTTTRTLQVYLASRPEDLAKNEGPLTSNPSSTNSTKNTMTGSKATHL